MDKERKSSRFRNTSKGKIKRSKLEPVPSSGSSISAIDTDCFIVEEEESSRVTKEDVFEPFKKTSNELRNVFSAALKAKKNKTDMSAYTTDVSVLVMKLKQLNRLDKHCFKKSCDKVQEKKLKTEVLSEQLHNLQYEEAFLQSELRKCNEFKFDDESINLVPVEEFYKEAPKEFSQPERTKKDEHALMLKRLQWESKQRKRLVAKVKEFEAKKEESKKEIVKLMENIKGVEPVLTNILKAAEPLQTKLGMPLQEMDQKHNALKFLPIPLSVLYVEMCAYREVCDKKIAVIIEGDVDAARVPQLDSQDFVEVNNTESDDLGESSSPSYEKYRGKSRRKDVLKKHPLSVSLTVEGKNSKIVVLFHYLVYLDIVTVSVKAILPKPPSSAIIGKLLCFETILNCLFPGDTGENSPNPANKYFLHQLKWKKTFAHNKTGIPYVWAQKICGLRYIQINQSSSSPETDEDNVPLLEQTITSIRSRLEARITLSAQMTSFAQGLKVPEALAEMYSQHVVSLFKRWSVICFEDLSCYPNFQELLDLNVVSKNAMIYKAEVERGTALLTAYVNIFPDYPASSPVFLLVLQWRSLSTADSNFALRELEEEVNIKCVNAMPENQRLNILICQLYHLLACFDVFLQTETVDTSLEGNNEFLKEKSVTKHCRGRGRNKPYKYVSPAGIFTFQ